MITHLGIKGYRGIREGALDGLAPLTILVGPNSSGKSSVLEALMLAGARGDGWASGFVLQRRRWIGSESVTAWMPSGFFTVEGVRDGEPFLLEAQRLVDRVRIKYDGRTSDLGFSSGTLQVAAKGRPTPSFVDVEAAPDPAELDRAVSAAEKVGNRKLLIELLRPLLPNIADLRILNPSGLYALHIEDDSGPPWPAIGAGDGVKKILLLSARVAADVSGLVLVEEPETFLHVGAMRQVSSLFRQAVAGGKQIVAATHSLELIDALLEEGADLSKLAIFRMSLRQGQLRAIRVPGERARELRMELQEDLRR